MEPEQALNILFRDSNMNADDIMERKEEKEKNCNWGGAVFIVSLWLLALMHILYAQGGELGAQFVTSCNNAHERLHKGFTVLQIGR